MGHAHHHHHVDPEAGDRRVALAVGVNLALTAAQVVGGTLAGSLSLIADALHNLSDAVSLVIAFVARKVARRPSDERMTFGYARAEIVAALVNYTTLIVIGLYLVFEAATRFVEPVPVTGWVVVIVAGVALAVDLVTAGLTWALSRSSVNMRAAFVHNLSDALGSVAVIVAGTLIILFDWWIVDPLVTLGIAGYILWLSFAEIGPVIRMLMLGSPPDTDGREVVRAMRAVDGVADVHHLHLWAARRAPRRARRARRRDRRGLGPGRRDQGRGARRAAGGLRDRARDARDRVRAPRLRRRRAVRRRRRRPPCRPPCRPPFRRPRTRRPRRRRPRRGALAPMSLHSGLLRREAENRPIRVALVGGGKFGSMFAAQVVRTPGMHLVAIADRDPGRVRQTLARVGWPAGRFAATNLYEARVKDITAVVDDVDAVLGSDHVDVVIEATGDPAAGIRHATLAFGHAKHVVMVNVEADALAGPLLARRASEAGVVYSLAWGDQPALIADLVDWARTAGFEVVAAGQGHQVPAGLPRVHARHRLGALRHRPRGRRRGGMNPTMFNSFLDGTKSAIEMAAVANACGLDAPVGGLAFPPCDVDDLADVLKPVADGGALSARGRSRSCRASRATAPTSRATCAGACTRRSPPTPTTCVAASASTGC